MALQLVKKINVNEELNKFLTCMIHISIYCFIVEENFYCRSCYAMWSFFALKFSMKYFSKMGMSFKRII